ncbi:MAG: hypothetical protein IPH64_18490 [Comamonadaceae bacterium]|nr:hypothetical protein [Comamonadaceae bacterium]
MNRAVSIRRLGLAGISALFLSACAGYSSSALTPGASTLPEVVATMGQPAMTWKNADGSQQLAFATGPGGTQTFMVFVAPDGKLQRIVGVLNERLLRPHPAGMTWTRVRLLGPSSVPSMPYRRTDTPTWSWLYCQSQNVQQYSDVNLDAGTGRVRFDRAAPVDAWIPCPARRPCVMQNIDLP